MAYRESVGSVWQGIFLHHGLHIVRFKLCTMSLMALGIIEGGLENLMTPHLCIPADCLYVVRFVLSCRFYVCIQKIEIISVAKYALC